MPSLAFDHHGAVSQPHHPDAPRQPTWRDPIDKHEWLVRPIPHPLAVAFIAEHHYAGGASNTSVARVGLYHRDGDELLGVAIYLPPPGQAAKSVSRTPKNVLALSRLAIHPSAPKNAASYLISRSIHTLPERYQHLLTWADQARHHAGTIYQATNWRYAGITRPAPIYTAPDGRHVSRKRGPTTLTHDQMLERGYALLGRFARHAYHLDRARVHARLERPYPKPQPQLFAR